MVDKEPTGAEPPPIVTGVKGARRDNSPLGVRIYYEIMERAGGTPRHKRVRRRAREFLERIGPRDALEQILAEQILWMHGTMAMLSHFAALQSARKNMKVLHEARDRLSEACRKHILAFQQYRHPRQTSFTAVRQANIAQQQIVASGVLPRRRGRIAKGENDAGLGRIISGEEKTRVPVERGGAGGSAGEDSGDSAVAIQHGAADGGGEEAV